MFTWTGPDNAVYKCVLDNQEQFDCEFYKWKCFLSCFMSLPVLSSPGASGYKLAFSEAGAGEHTFVVKAIVSSQEVASGTATFTVPSKCQPFCFYENSTVMNVFAIIPCDHCSTSTTKCSN